MRINHDPHFYFGALMIKVIVNMLDEEWEALSNLADATLRPIDREARWLIRCGLANNGWLDLDGKSQEECMKKSNEE